MKPPLTYYGGKQQLASKIVSLIPEHKIYCEPFVGGGAVFFAKKPSNFEIINDINSEIINFYQVLKQNFPDLQAEIQISLHSRKLYEKAKVIYENPEMFDNVKRAWAVWMLSNTSFCHDITAGFSGDKGGTTTRALASKKALFTTELSKRIENLLIENLDALRIIELKDSSETFFYLDPPYVGTCQGHYDGYSQDDFDRLICSLSKIKGKFLLSSFRNENLTKAVKNNNWYQIELKMRKTASVLSEKYVTKIEVLTANYPIGIENENVKILS